MSSLLVQVRAVDEVYPHPNADALEFIRVGGWPVLVQKSLGLKPGDRVAYFPPDTVMTIELADRLGIRKYLSPVKADGDTPEGFRVRAAVLRGAASYGTIDHAVDPSWEDGRDVREHYGVWKYEPPVASIAGDALPDVPAFHGYTDIEHIQNFPGVLEEGDGIAIHEKVHGSNCRLGYVRMPDGTFEFVAGSHNVRRRPVNEKGRPSYYWEPLTENVREFLRAMSTTRRGGGSVVLFGELYGSGVQDMAYGLVNGQKAFRVFDIAIDGRYLDYELGLSTYLADWAIPAIPELYRGPFSWAVVEEHTRGDTTLCDPAKAGKFRGREGCVVRPTSEWTSDLMGGRRVIFKSVSADYLARKGGTDGH